MGGLTFPLFLCKMNKNHMDRDKLKMIIRNMELLLDSIKAEVYSDVKSYRYEDIKPEELDYDEVFEESNLDD